MTGKRICIFCGERPEDKNNEHPLPRWLLEMTGDPNRVVRHGVHWGTRKPFEFAFDAFQFPACRKCNDVYSELETAAKSVVVKICQMRPAAPDEYVTLLDWLDKVRVGLWLGHNYLQGNILNPTFTISSRLAEKDRMVAVYAFPEQCDGLNTWGPDSPLFHFKPSIFAMKVNKILFLNASWDWMCASRCGYPYPQNILRSKEFPGLYVASNFRCRKKITHPILPGLHKPCVMIFQPVLSKDPSGVVNGLNDEMNEYVDGHAWPNRHRLGPLFRQFTASTVSIHSGDPNIEFGKVSFEDARRAADISTQAYTMLVDSLDREPGQYEDGSMFDGAYLKEAAKYNTRVAKYLRQLPKQEYEKRRAAYAIDLHNRIAREKRPRGASKTTE